MPRLRSPLRWVVSSAPSASPFEGATGLLTRVGGTPLVRLSRSVEGVVASGVEVHVKLEAFNPGGSVKDRAALSMVLAAVRSGRLRPGGTILDASSGNTGIAYAMIAAHLGYKLKLCLPKNANRERQGILRAYGAEILYTDPLEGTDGAIRLARELSALEPDLVYLDQYSNPANWGAHYGSTAPEIWAQTGGRWTHFVAGLGTTGTFVGTSRWLRDHAPTVQTVAVQPDGPMHGLEGLKHLETAMVPPIWDPSLVGRHLGAPTVESWTWMRRLGREEGIFTGPSGGAALWAAVEVARELDSGVVVAILPDSGERYLSESHLWEGL